MVGGQDCVSVLAGHQDQPEQAPLSPQRSPISCYFCFFASKSLLSLQSCSWLCSETLLGPLQRQREVLRWEGSAPC